MTLFDWCAHGQHSLCHHLGGTPDGREVRCTCECHGEVAA